MSTDTMWGAHITRFDFAHSKDLYTTGVSNAKGGQHRRVRMSSHYVARLALRTACLLDRLVAAELVVASHGERYAMTTTTATNARLVAGAICG